MSTTMRYVHHGPGARDAELLAAVFSYDDDPRVDGFRPSVGRSAKGAAA
jgi:hypothetical protein